LLNHIHTGTSSGSRRRRLAALILFGLGYLAISQLSRPIYALPPNFQDSVVWSGLNLPTAMRFAPTGQVFVAEKGGVIKTFDSLSDSTPTVFADLSNEVLDYSDSGLLGLAVDPGFPARPYIYAFYSVDAPPGTAPPYYHDVCNSENCPNYSRLLRITANASGSAAVGQQVMIDGWCQMNPIHSVGTLAFGADGFLYVSHGEGGSAADVDYGNSNVCGDPNLEGGALRAQDIRTPGDPVGYGGAILRINPDTGAAAPGNPLVGGTIAGDDPIIAMGLRNPYRFAIDPTTARLWIADVGWNSYEEINTLPSPFASIVNFGWPCYEGPARQPGYDAVNLPICESLYLTTEARTPHYSYAHSGAGAAVSGIALYRGSNFPAAYDGALFFADYVRGWIKVMAPGANGLPDANNIVDFVPSGSGAVDLQIGPGGELFYVNIYTGTIRKITYVSANTPPVAQMTADVTSGPPPLAVQFDAAGSHDVDPGDNITYAWDLNGDGVYAEGAGTTASFTYTARAAYNARLRVTDSHGGVSTALIVIVAGASAPIPTVDAPLATVTYRVGTTIPFSGTAIDPDTSLPLPASALSWRVLLNHCAVANPTDCHEHFLQQFAGVAGGTIQAPDHEYPSYLRFELTATKPPAAGLPQLVAVASQSINPQTTTVTLDSVPSGLQVAIYGATGATPFTRTMIVGAQTTVSAPTPQAVGGLAYEYSSWSDSGGQTHSITAGTGPLALTATYASTGLPLQSIWNSWDVVTQAGTPQATVTAPLTGSIATIEFYESSNNAGVLQGATFGSFTTAPHPEAFNSVERYRGTGTGTTYPYAGKSTVNRGSGVGETNTPPPLGVRDLQLHPPNNPHLTVAAFRAPTDGTYTISNLAVRRVSNLGGPVMLRLFNSQQTQIATLTASTNRAWVTSASVYTLPSVAAGSYIYFAVDNAGDYGWDATEVSWTITATTGPPPLPPTCTLSVLPPSIDQGTSANLAWTTTNAASLSINQNVGTVTPSASGLLAVAPLVTTTYTGTVSGPGGVAQCSTTLTVIPSASTASVWNSWDVAPQAGSPQALVTSPTTAVVANVEFYESINDNGVAKGALFGTFNTGAHPETFNAVERLWGAAAGNVYPYAGKSTVNRGLGAGETNAPMPLGVRDLQLHPPNNLHLAVSAFRVPVAGSYTLSNLGLRRVSDLGGTVGLHVFNAQQVEIATMTATANRAWVTSPATYTLSNLSAGSYVYFAVDRAGDYGWDATEVTWTVTALLGPAPPAPSCTLTAMPASVNQGGTTSLTWTTVNATNLSIDNGIGGVAPVAGGMVSSLPLVNTTYTATASGAGGTAQCTASVTVIPSPTTTSSWNSWDVTTQAGSPQALVMASASGITANLEIYESTNDGGVARGALLPGFTAGTHPETFNLLERYWGPGTGTVYPYAGKSTVSRGSGAGETNTPMPLGVRDFQLHPPNNLHLVVAAFRVPQDGTYTVSNLGVRRVSNLGGNVGFHLFNPQQVQIAALTATNNRAWVVSPTVHTLTNVTAGTYIYFALDRAGDYGWDAAELAWTITRTGP
jgi:glucose/arabinose dehydrogenase